MSDQKQSNTTTDQQIDRLLHGIDEWAADITPHRSTRVRLQLQAMQVRALEGIREQLVGIREQLDRLGPPRAG